MTDLIELAQCVCMGEHVPPLKDGISPQVAFDAMFAPMKDQIAEMDKQAAKIAEAARLAREAEDGDQEPWSAQP